MSMQSGKGMKQSTLRFKGSKVKSLDSEDRLGSLAEAPFSAPFGKALLLLLVCMS